MCFWIRGWFVGLYFLEIEALHRHSCCFRCCCKQARTIRFGSYNPKIGAAAGILRCFLAEEEDKQWRKLACVCCVILTIESDLRGRYSGPATINPADCRKIAFVWQAITFTNCRFTVRLACGGIGCVAHVLRNTMARPRRPFFQPLGLMCGNILLRRCAVLMLIVSYSSDLFFRNVAAGRKKDACIVVAACGMRKHVCKQYLSQTSSCWKLFCQHRQCLE